IIIRAEKIILNGEKRLGLHFDPKDFSFVSLIIKLPDCRWSPGIHSWHISFREDYLSFLNKTCPDPLLFIDVTPDMIMKYHEGIPADKRVIMDKSDPELKQVLNYLIMMGY